MKSSSAFSKKHFFKICVLKKNLKKIHLPKFTATKLQMSRQNKNPRQHFQKYALKKMRIKKKLEKDTPSQVHSYETSDEPPTMKSSAKHFKKPFLKYSFKNAN